MSQYARMKEDVSELFAPSNDYRKDRQNKVLSVLAGLAVAIVVATVIYLAYATLYLFGWRPGTFASFLGLAFLYTAPVWAGVFTFGLFRRDSEFE